MPVTEAIRARSLGAPLCVSAELGARNKEVGHGVSFQYLCQLQAAFSQRAGSSADKTPVTLPEHVCSSDQ